MQGEQHPPEGAEPDRPQRLGGRAVAAGDPRPPGARTLFDLGELA